MMLTRYKMGQEIELSEIWTKEDCKVLLERRYQQGNKLMEEIEVLLKENEGILEWANDKKLSKTDEEKTTFRDKFKSNNEAIEKLRLQENKVSQEIEKIERYLRRLNRYSQWSDSGSSSSSPRAAG